MIEFTNLVLRRTLEEDSLKPVNVVTLGDSLKESQRTASSMEEFLKNLLNENQDGEPPQSENDQMSLQFH